jgi:Domain of unknown function (DUF4440)
MHVQSKASAHHVQLPAAGPDAPENTFGKAWWDAINKHDHAFFDSCLADDLTKYEPFGGVMDKQQYIGFTDICSNCIATNHEISFDKTFIDNGETYRVLKGFFHLSADVAGQASRDVPATFMNVWRLEDYQGKKTWREVEYIGKIGNDTPADDAQYQGHIDAATAFVTGNGPSANFKLLKDYNYSEHGKKFRLVEGAVQSGGKNAVVFALYEKTQQGWKLENQVTRFDKV